MTGSRIRTWMPLAAIATAALSAAPARAGDAALSETLFREGRALMDAGDYAKGCPKLAASYDEDPATGTLLALALCHEKAGHLASAWASYVDAASRSHQEGRKDRETAATERVQALEPRLSKLVIQVDGVVAGLQGLSVTRDGKPVSEAAFGTSVPTDGGEHVIEAHADGKQPFRAVVTLRPEGDAQTVTIGSMPDAAQPTSAPVPSPAPTAPITPAETGKGLSTLQIVGIGTAGLGVVGLGASLFFTLRANSLNHKSNDEGCNGRLCPPDAAATRRDAVNAGDLATVFVVAGGVLAAGGVTLVLVGGNDEKRPEAAALRVTPVSTPSALGLLAEGRF